MVGLWQEEEAAAEAEAEAVAAAEEAAAGAEEALSAETGVEPDEAVEVLLAETGVEVLAKTGLAAEPDTDRIEVFVQDGFILAHDTMAAALITAEEEAVDVVEE